MITLVGEASFITWLAERCELVDPDDRPTNSLPRASDLYLDYAMFQSEIDKGNVMSLPVFGRLMVGRFARLKADGIKYRGLRLRS